MDLCGSAPISLAWPGQQMQVALPAATTRQGPPIASSGSSTTGQVFCAATSFALAAVALTILTSGRPAAY